jgi:hypothetical protein
MRLQRRYEEVINTILFPCPSLSHYSGVSGKARGMSDDLPMQGTFWQWGVLSMWGLERASGTRKALSPDTVREVHPKLKKKIIP